MIQNNNQINPDAQSLQMDVSGSVFLQIGMHVKIKEHGNHGEDCGKIKEITKDLPLFNNRRAFELDGSEYNGIWLIADFEYCIEYPNLSMR